MLMVSGVLCVGVCGGRSTVFFFFLLSSGEMKARSHGSQASKAVNLSRGDSTRQSSEEKTSLFNSEIDQLQFSTASHKWHLLIA